MSKVPQHLIDEAFAKGNKPGAVVIPPGLGRQQTIPPIGCWSLDHDGDIRVNRGSDDAYLIYCRGKWATVITPAPSEAEGLKEGDACECSPAMRAAIVELAKELGVPCGHALDTYMHADVCGLWYDQSRPEVCTCIPQARYTCTPEAFIAKMRVTAAEIAAKPKVHTINGHAVKVSDVVEVNDTVYSIDTIRQIAKLIDP